MANTTNSDNLRTWHFETVKISNDSGERYWDIDEIPTQSEILDNLRNNRHMYLSRRNRQELLETGQTWVDGLNYPVRSELRETEEG